MVAFLSPAAPAPLSHTVAAVLLRAAAAPPLCRRPSWGGGCGSRASSSDDGHFGRRRGGGGGVLRSPPPSMGGRMKGHPRTGSRHVAAYHSLSPAAGEARWRPQAVGGALAWGFPHSRVLAHARAWWLVRSVASSKRPRAVSVWDAVRVLLTILWRRGRWGRVPSTRLPLPFSTGGPACNHRRHAHQRGRLFVGAGTGHSHLCSFPRGTRLFFIALFFLC